MEVRYNWQIITNHRFLRIPLSKIIIFKIVQETQQWHKICDAFDPVKVIHHHSKLASVILLTNTVVAIAHILPHLTSVDLCPP